MQKAKCSVYEEERWLDEVTDIKGDIHEIYMGCLVKYFYYLEGKTVFIEEAEILFKNEKIRTDDFNNRNSILERIENYQIDLAYDAKKEDK